MSEVRGGWEELPRIRGQWRWPRGATLHPRSVAARRRYPVSEVKGGDPEEPPRARGQGRQLGRSHPRPRLGLAARRSNPRSGG